MGSASEAPVVISSDEEDGGKMPAAAKRKSPEDDALAWAEGILDQDDCDDAVVDGVVGYPAMMLEFMDSLKDATGIVVGDKEPMVGDKVPVAGDKNTAAAPDACGGGDDDDDADCVILDGDPEKPVAVANEEQGPSRDAAEDELQIVAEKGEVACRDFPHPRHLCATLPFSTSSHASHCSMCHCYVCDCPAPCAFWDNHCHATDMEPKWKTLRQISQNKSQPNPKRRMPQHFNHRITAGPSSHYSANAIGFTGRFPIPGNVNQIQQVDTSIMVAQNMGQAFSRPGAPSPMARPKIPNYGSKGAQIAPPLYTSPNGNHLQPSVPSYVLSRPFRPRVSQTAQVTSGGYVSAETLQRNPSQFCAGASMGSQGHLYRPPSYPQVAPNTVVGTGVPLSRCSSLNAQAQGIQRTQVPLENTIFKESLANLSHRMGFPDKNTNQPLGQQLTSTPQYMHMHPRDILASGAQKARQAYANKSYVSATSQIVSSSGHSSSNHAPGGTVLSPGSVQIQQPLRQLKLGTVVSSGSAQIQQRPLCQLNSQCSVAPSVTAPKSKYSLPLQSPNTLYLPPP